MDVDDAFHFRAGSVDRGVDCPAGAVEAESRGSLVDDGFVGGVQEEY